MTEFRCLDDESGTATEDEEDVRARELRKQEVWLQMPPRSSDTDTGSETEVKDSQGSIDLVVAQDSLLSPDCKVTLSSVSNTNGSEPPSDRNDHEGPPESSDTISSENTLASNESIMSTRNRDNATSVDENDTSLNAISQVSSQGVIPATGSSTFSSLAPNNVDGNISGQNGFSISLTNIAVDANKINDDANCSDREVLNSEYESFVDENSRLEDLSGLNTTGTNRDELQRNGAILEVNEVNMINSNLRPTDLIANVNNSATNADSIRNFALDLSADNSSEQIAGITLANTCTPCAGTGKDFRVSDSETALNVDDLPDVIASTRRGSRDSLSSSLSEIYRSTEVLNGDSVIGNHLDDSTNCSKSDLPEAEIELRRRENISFISKGENSGLINENRSVDLIDDSSSNIRVNDKKIGAQQLAIPTITTIVVPIVTVTSPSPTQEKQLEELTVETSRLLAPRDPCDIPSSGSCDSVFDKLKRDVKQRKAKNRAVGNELRPLSTEHARLKMSKYFMENKKTVANNRPTRNEEAEDEPDMEVVKLDIKPKLSGKVNAQEMLKYFKGPSSSNNSRDKSKVCNATKTAIVRNEPRKLEIDIEGISDVSEKDMDAIEQQFHQIEEQNAIAYSTGDYDGMGSNFSLSALQILGSEEVIRDDLTLTSNDLIELQSESNPDIDSPISSHNVSKLESRDMLDSKSHIDLENDILNLHTATLVSDVSILCTDIESDVQTDVTNERQEVRKIDLAGNLKDEINVALSGGMLESDTFEKENVVEVSSQSGILDSIDSAEEKKVNPVDKKGMMVSRDSTNGDEQADKVDTSSDDISSDADKDKKSSEIVSLKCDTRLNAELNASSPLENTNANKVVGAYNALHKSDPALSENTPCADRKSTGGSNSKSLTELSGALREDASATKVTVIEEATDATVNIKDVTNEMQSCIEGVPKRPERKHLCSRNTDVSSMKNTTTAAPNFTTTPHAALPAAPPEIPARKKSAKRSFELSNGHRDSEDTKLQSRIVENTAKLKSRDIPDIQSHDIENISKPPRQNVRKMRNHNTTNLLSSEVYEMAKDSKGITQGTQNRNNADVRRSESQDKSVPTSSTQQRTRHSANSRCLSDRLEESAKFIADGDQSRKDKCVIS